MHGIDSADYNIDMKGTHVRVRKGGGKTLYIRQQHARKVSLASGIHGIAVMFSHTKRKYIKIPQITKEQEA